MPVKFIPQLGFLSEFDKGYINRWLGISGAGISMVGLLRELFFEEDCMHLGQDRMILDCLDDQIDMKMYSLSIQYLWVKISSVCKRSRNYFLFSSISEVDHTHTVHKMYNYKTCCPLISFFRRWFFINIRTLNNEDLTGKNKSNKFINLWVWIDTYWLKIKISWWKTLFFYFTSRLSLSLFHPLIDQFIS